LSDFKRGTGTRLRTAEGLTSFFFASTKGEDLMTDKMILTPVTAYEKKAVECDDCGAVTEIPKWMTLKESWCKECQSMKIRLYKPRKRKEARPK
jgi:hypothetical protein